MADREESNMTALAAEPAWETLSAAESLPQADPFRILDLLPETRLWRAEILDGENITLSPAPSGLHGRNVRVLERALAPALPADTDYETYLELRFPEQGRGTIPDFFVAPTSVLETSDSRILPDEVLFVAEVVSPGSAKADRAIKPGIYAGAGIDYFLLVDPIRCHTVLHRAPARGEYTSVIQQPFGPVLKIGDPFATELDTSRFHPYE